MTRALMIASLATASLTAFSTPASAQSYGGVTLSFGSAPYGGYDEDAYNEGYYRYADPRFRRDDDDRYAWRAHERREQIERWRQEQERRQSWQHERREHQRWGDDDD